MPWSVTERDGKFCVVKDSDGSTVACHETREKALAQQRALYANEPSVSAALEVDTTALMEEFFPDPEPQPIKIEVGSAPTDALVSALRSLSERLIETETRQVEIIEVVRSLMNVVSQDREQLISSLDALALAFKEQPAPVVNVEPPAVNVTVPEPVVNVQPPEVNVTLEAPTTHRRVVVERDPVTGLIASAEVEEVTDG